MQKCASNVVTSFNLQPWKFQDQYQTSVAVSGHEFHEWKKRLEKNKFRLETFEHTLICEMVGLVCHMTNL